MRTTGFSVRRTAALAAWLLAVALAVAGCAALTAALHTSSALQGAGYQNVNVNVASGSGLPPGGLVTVSYSSGPSGNDQSDAQRAENIVWDTFSGHFGALEIVRESGGCAGPFCATHSDEVAGATYAQLAARFGPRPHGLDTASATPAVPGWALGLGVGLAVAVIAAAAIAVTLILKRKRNRPPGPPWSSWPPGPSGPSPWPPGPPAG